MAESPTIVLCAGGLRSLVATAVVLGGNSPQHVRLLHVQDTRSGVERRLEATRRQAQHYKIEQETLATLDRQGPGSPSSKPPRLRRCRLLMAALAHAVELKARCLVWPGQFDANHDEVARATEQLVLVEHLAQIDETDLPSIESPLIDLSDRQMLELGAQLEVPWELAWSCLLEGERPCMACPACLRRRNAFEQVALTDPVQRARGPSRTAVG
jgi:7-cyano-7-deazaguanine synthase